MTDLYREQLADRQREKRHGLRKTLMSILLAILVIGGAYLLFTSKPAEDELAQSEVSMPAFQPSGIAPPTALPPVPLPDATPMPKAAVPADRPLP